MGEAPALAFSEANYITEESLRFLAIQKMLLIRRSFVGISRRKHYSVDAHCHDGIEESSDALGLCSVEQNAIDADPKAECLRLMDRRNRPVEHTRLTH